MEWSTYRCGGKSNAILNLFDVRDAGLIPAPAAKFFNVQIFYSNFFVTFFYIFTIFVAISLKMKSKFHNEENQIIIYERKFE